MTDGEIKVKESYFDQLASEIRALTERAEKAERELADVQEERNRLLLMAEECDLAHGPLVAELAAAREAMREDRDRFRDLLDRIAESERKLAIHEGFGSRPELKPVTPRPRASAEDPSLQGGGT